MATPEEQRDTRAKLFSQIVAKAWTDADFKRRLLAEPEAVFRDHGFHIPDGIRVAVHEDDTATANVVLPRKPAGLSDEQLSHVAGGLSTEFIGNIADAHLFGSDLPDPFKGSSC